MANYKNLIVTKPDGGTLVEATADAILMATDWTQLPNSGLTSDCVTAFVTYRESIRTIRRANPSSPTWATAPTEEWS